MNPEMFQLEGTWEEILKQSDQLTGHRVRVIVLPTKTQLKDAIAFESQKELEKLNPDYLIGYSETGNIPQSDETIRFGDLPQEEQESIQQALASQARGELERWEFE